MSLHAFDLLHCDIWGPFHVSTHTSQQHFLSIVDDHTRYTWIHLMRHKYEASTLLQNFIIWVHTQFEVTINALCSDNARELTLSKFLAEHGINHQFSCVETPEQNSVVERKTPASLECCQGLILPISGSSSLLGGLCLCCSIFD